MEDNKKNVTVSITPSLPVLLTVAFVVLKLCGVISWSWLWVLSPLWIGFALGILLLIVLLIIAVIIGRK